jgi:hypothetical protein
VSKTYLVVADARNSLRVFWNASLESYKRWKINRQPILVVATDAHIGAFLEDQTIFICDISDGAGRTSQIRLPEFAVPQSLAFENADKILIGTSQGELIAISDSQGMIVEKIADTPIILRSGEAGIIASGTNPFLIENGTRYFINCGDCEDIAQSDGWICTLYGTGIAIMRKTSSGFCSRLVRRVPGLIDCWTDSSASRYICLVESDQGEQSVVRLSGEKSKERRYVQGKDRISFFKVLEIDTKRFVILGDEKPSIILLDENLELLLCQKMLGIVTAACLVTGFMAVARPGAIDFFILRGSNDEYELERKFIVESHFLTPDLIAIDQFLIASGQQQAIIVYRVEQDSVQKISQDCSPKRLNKLITIGNLLFAASYGPALYCYALNEGMLKEIGSFQCDSRIMGFCILNDKLYYGTEGGGIGTFEPGEDADWMKIRDAANSEEIRILADRVPPATFEWKQENIFVDFDNVKALARLPDKLRTQILARAGVEKSKLGEIIGEVI